MKILVCLILVGLCSGCFTPPHVQRLRERRFQKARPPLVGVETRATTIYAGVDVYGLKEALQDDPGGTAAALAKDGLVAAGTALAGYLAYDESKGDDKGKSVPSIPTMQAETAVINQGNGTLNYNVQIGD